MYLNKKYSILKIQKYSLNNLKSFFNYSKVNNTNSNNTNIINV